MRLSPVDPLWTGEVKLDSSQGNHMDQVCQNSQTTVICTKWKKDTGQVSYSNVTPQIR